MAVTKGPATPSPSGMVNIDELPLARQRVLIRVDFDVPLSESGEVLDDRKLRAALPTLRKALSDGARLVLATHLSGPEEKPVSLEPVALKLAELLQQDVILPDECVGDAARKVVGDLRDGQLCLLENLFFAAEERRNDEGFARKLAGLCDVYVAEAFACAQFAHASLVALPRLVKDRGLGYAFAAELAALTRLSVAAPKPFVGVLGGASLARNLDVLEVMLRRCDAICVGGVPGNTLLAARQHDLKQSRVEREQLALGRALLDRARDARVELLLPLDVAIADGDSDSAAGTVSVGAIPDGHAALDVGPKTLAMFQARVSGGRSVLLHGALGRLENPAFAQGTRGVLEALSGAQAHGVITGEALTACAKQLELELEKPIGFVSTGGMASLSVIEGKKLPGIEALRE